MDEYLPMEYKAIPMSRWLHLTNFDGRDVVINVSKIHSLEEYDNDKDTAHPYAETRIETSCQVWHVRENIEVIRRWLGVK